MRRLAATLAVLVFVICGCSKGEDKVDLNPGKGHEGVGNKHAHDHDKG